MSVNTYIFTGHIFADEPLSTCSKDLKDREGEKNKPTPIPYQQTSSGPVYYFPSSGIRGSLRRAAASVVLDKTIERTGEQKPFSLDEHYAMVLGGVKGSEIQERFGITLVEGVLAKNPLLAVFGAGDGGVLGFVEGKLAVGSAYCEPGVEPVVFSGARTDEFFRSPDRVKYLSDDDLSALVGRSIANRESSLAKKEVDGLTAEMKKIARSTEDADIARVAAIKEQIASIEEARDKSLKDAGAKSVSVGLTLAGYKAIPRGEKLEHTLKLFRANEIELGLLLATLQRFALEPILGAHSANGLGTVSACWSVRQVNTTGVTELGSVSFDPFANLNIKGEVLRGALAAFNDFILNGPADFSIPKMPAKSSDDTEEPEHADESIEV